MTGDEPLCPECADGLHDNCAGDALDRRLQGQEPLVVACQCPTCWTTCGRCFGEGVIDVFDGFGARVPDVDCPTCAGRGTIHV